MGLFGFLRFDFMTQTFSEWWAEQRAGGNVYECDRELAKLAWEAGYEKGQEDADGSDDDQVGRVII